MSAGEGRGGEGRGGEGVREGRDGGEGVRGGEEKGGGRRGEGRDERGSMKSNVLKYVSTYV